jgi:hypothetical protein
MNNDYRKIDIMSSKLHNIIQITYKCITNVKIFGKIID